MQKICEKKTFQKLKTDKYNFTFTRVYLKIAQNEVNWFQFIEFYIFEGRSVELLQKKTIQKPDKTNITSFLHVFFLNEQ
jgi:hypothetical protein